MIIPVTLRDWTYTKNVRMVLPMTSTEYRAALVALGLNQRQAAELLGVVLRTSQKYANGSPIPKTIELLLNRLIVEQDKS